MEIFNLFRRKPKYIVCVDLSELPDEINTDVFLHYYKKYGICFFRSFLNADGTKEPLNSHIIKV